MAEGQVYGSTEELIAGVSAETGVSQDDVRKVLRASFESTKDFILTQLGEGASEGTEELDDSALDEVAGGLGRFSTYGLRSLSQLRMPDLRAKLRGGIYS